jgi:hypothetical protein
MAVGGRLARHSNPYRYVWPADWDRSPFTAPSARHVTVYRMT